MNIDHELRDALRRKQAPADLADRVLAHVNAAPAPSIRTASPWADQRRWLAAAAVFALAIGGAGRYYTQQQQAAEAARVRKDIRIALQITNDTIARLQNKMSPSADDGRR